MWRISNDFWDVWSTDGKSDFPQSLKGQFDRLAAWSNFDLKPGQWPDADMLPLGELRPSPGWGDPRHTRLTPDEQKTVMTLWAITQSPLILGANLTLLDDATLRLLTNDEVLRLDQHATARGRPLPGFRTGDLRVWRAEVKPSHRLDSPVRVALFNLTDAPMQVDRARRELGLPDDNSHMWVREIWSKGFVSRAGNRVKLTIPPHGCVLLELVPENYALL
jgi:hypothetical protein